MRCTLILRDEQACHPSSHGRLRSLALEALAEDPHLEAVEIVDRRGAGTIFRRGGDVRLTAGYRLAASGA